MIKATRSLCLGVGVPLVAAALFGTPQRAALADAAAGPPASAESAERAELQEVVVTATRHEEALSKVPISVTALTQEALDARVVLPGWSRSSASSMKKPRRNTGARKEPRRERGRSTRKRHYSATAARVAPDCLGTSEASRPSWPSCSIRALPMSRSSARRIISSFWWFGAWRSISTFRCGSFPVPLRQTAADWPAAPGPRP